MDVLTALGLLVAGSVIGSIATTIVQRRSTRQARLERLYRDDLAAARIAARSVSQQINWLKMPWGSEALVAAAEQVRRSVDLVAPDLQEIATEIVVGAREAQQGESELGYDHTVHNSAGDLDVLDRIEDAIDRIDHELRPRIHGAMPNRLTKAGRRARAIERNIPYGIPGDE